MKGRLEKLVEDIRIAPTPADGVRAIRAVELLEQLSTPAARAHLTALAGGVPAATLTRAAADALHRLETGK
jgi:hypothetical protein